MYTSKYIPSVYILRYIYSIIEVILPSSWNTAQMLLDFGKLRLQAIGGYVPSSGPLQKCTSSSPSRGGWIYPGPRCLRSINANALVINSEKCNLTGVHAIGTQQSLLSWRLLGSATMCISTSTMVSVPESETPPYHRRASWTELLKLLLRPHCSANKYLSLTSQVAWN